MTPMRCAGRSCAPFRSTICRRSCRTPSERPACEAARQRSTSSTPQPVVLRRRRATRSASAQSWAALPSKSPRPRAAALPTMCGRPGQSIRIFDCFAPCASAFVAVACSCRCSLSAQCGDPGSNLAAERDAPRHPRSPPATGAKPSAHFVQERVHRLPSKLAVHLPSSEPRSPCRAAPTTGCAHLSSCGQVPYQAAGLRVITAEALRVSRQRQRGAAGNMRSLR